jgi:hypothetical protein
LLDEQRLISDFEMIGDDHFILAEGTGKIIEVHDGQAEETADLHAILSGVHHAADGCLYAFGLDGRAFRRRRGVWRDLPLLDSHVFCLRSTPTGILYCCGSNGLFARFDESQWDVLELGTNVDLQSLLILDDERVVVCGMSGFAGIWESEAWNQWDVPDFDYYDLASFKGNIYVGAGSDGLAVVEEEAFGILKRNIFSYTLRAGERYLAISGNNEIVRYDGNEYPCLEFNYEFDDD